MKQVQFLGTTLNSPKKSQRNKLTARSFYRSPTDVNWLQAPSISRSNSVFNTDLPRYHKYSNYYFDKASQQAAKRRREMLLRRAAAMLAASVMAALLFYISYTSIDANTHLSFHASTHPTPDQIFLYRVLGNDLPPRHKFGQTLQNVHFILENEAEFPNTKKWWILNRIIDSKYEQALIDLLKRHQQEYIRIPFEAEAYLKTDFRLEDFPEPDFYHTDEYLQLSKVGKLRTIDYTYHDKNIYAMNNNGGRNTALFHGKTQPRARWIMPFDGNCFFTKNAFAEIQLQLNTWGERYKYFIVPMARVINNTKLLTMPDIQPLAPEEPQIIFRNDADEAYNTNMRYGRRPKVELLRRLGVTRPRKVSNNQFDSWEYQETSNVHGGNQYKSIGWVFRLFSGQASQEENKKEASSLRAFNRLLAIQDFLDGLDERIARNIQGFDSMRLFQYDEKILERSRLSYWSGDSRVCEMVNHLIKNADEMLAAITNMFHEASTPVDDNMNTRYLGYGKKDHGPPSLPTTQNDNMAPFLWPQKKHEEFNEVLLDIEDEREDLAFKSLKEPEALYMNAPLPELLENVTTLTLAQYFSGHEPYARWAANLIRTFLLSSYAVGDQNDSEATRYNTVTGVVNDEGYRFPNLNQVPRTLPKFKHQEIQVTNKLLDNNLSGFLDACRLLYRSQIITHKEFTDLRFIASDWLEYFLSSPEGTNRVRLSNHRGTLYDLQILSLATFVDDLRLYLRVANRLRMRIGKHFHVTNSTNPSSITQDEEISFVKNEIYEGRQNSSYFDQNVFRFTTLNLQYWMLLTRGIQNSGVGADLWQYTSKGGQRLSRAIVAHLTMYTNQLEDERIKSLLHIAQTAHKASDTKRGIFHEHDRFLNVLKKIGGKIDIFPNDKASSSDLADSNFLVGIGVEARQWGILPYWMLGIA